MDDIRIDEMDVGDFEAVVGIVKFLPEWFTPRALEEIRRDAEKMLGFVVRVNGVVRGFVLLDVRECCVEIGWMAVEKMFQGRGLGTLLLRAAEQYACKMGRNVLTVKTYGGGDYEPYLRTMHFYRSRDFSLYEIIEEYGPFGAQPAAILIKPLKCQTNQHT